MDNQLSPTTIYEMIAAADFRKHFHLGGFEATKELLGLCPITEDSQVLEVGCASGRTACYLASTYRCRVIGVDLLPGMVERAEERAVREGVADRVEFRTGDAQDLAFEDERFDLLIGEFITGLVEDKQQAVGEYLRVTQPGGTIALNEATWLKPPSDEVAELITGVFGVRGDLLSSEAWQELLISAGLKELSARVYQTGSLSDRRDDLADLVRSLPRVLYMVLTDRRFRVFLKMSASMPKDFLEYFGYGLYVGRK